VTQPDGQSPPDASNQRERRWPAVADVDWWRSEAEYVPARRPPAGPPRDPEIDFDLDEPDGTTPPPATRLPPTPVPPTRPSATLTDVVKTEIVEPGAVAAGLEDADVGDPEVGDPEVGDPEVGDVEVGDVEVGGGGDSGATTPVWARTSSPWAGPAAGAPTGPYDAVDKAVDNAAQPVDSAVEAAVDTAVDEAAAQAKSGGIGGSDSPYARPPRVTRRDVAPAPRRVMPIPPAIITAPTPAESLVERAPSDVESTVIVPPPGSAGLSMFDSPDVGAIPTVPGPRRQPAAPRPVRRARRVRRNRPGRAWIGLPALLVLLFVAALVAWVSAEPFWLDAGHGTTGTGTVVSKTDRCRVTFAAAGGGFTTSTVDLAGVDPDQCMVGTAVPAQMVSADAARAYVADRAGLRLRWAVGAGVLLLCGWGIAWATGARRFQGWQRRTATAMSLSGPLVIAATMLAVTY
jgi:hypothetical protein